MSATPKSIRILVEPAVTCCDGVQRYRIVVDGRRVVVRRYSELVTYDRGLKATGGKPQLPTKGLIGFRKRYDLFEFNESRRAGIESYLRQLCGDEGDGSGPLPSLLAVTREELQAGGAAELQLYSSADLRAHGLTAPELHAMGRKSTSLVAAGFSLEELEQAGYKIGNWFLPLLAARREEHCQPELEQCQHPPAGHPEQQGASALGAVEGHCQPEFEQRQQATAGHAEQQGTEAPDVAEPPRADAE